MRRNKEINLFCQNIKRLKKTKRNNLNKKEMAKILGIGLTSLAKLEHCGYGLQ